MPASSLPAAVWTARFDGWHNSNSSSRWQDSSSSSSSYSSSSSSAAAADGDELVNRQVWQCVQEPGDVIYVPSGWHHSVLNLQQSVGIAIEVGENNKLWKTVPAVLGADEAEAEGAEAGG
eukprot:SAG22_NODE_953_length_6332_cov_5.830258_5_plen_120_part_00